MADIHAYNNQLIEEFRANSSNPGGSFPGRPLLLLTTTGAKSGLSRTTPLMYIADGERLLVIASNAGALTHPAWYHNLVAHPEVTVEVGSETYSARAHVLDGTERQELWHKIVEDHHFFGEHQAKISREIPVIALERN